MKSPAPAKPFRATEANDLETAWYWPATGDRPAWRATRHQWLAHPARPDDEAPDLPKHESSIARDLTSLDDPNHKRCSPEQCALACRQEDLQTTKQDAPWTSH